MKEQSRSFKFLGILIACVAYPSEECLVVVTQILADVSIACTLVTEKRKEKYQFLFCIRISYRCL